MDVQQVSQIVSTVDRSGLVSGLPGEWTLNSSHLIMAVNRHFAGPAVAAAPAGPSALALAPATATIIQTAVDKSNAAASSTPAAGSGQPVSSQTPSDTVTSILQQLNVVANIAQDIQAIEGGGTAQLHWWGWEATLNEAATQGLLHLLGADMTSVSAIAAALIAVSPVLAAVGGILSIVSNTFAQEISSADSNHNGVNLKGYLWVALKATAI